MQNTKEKVAISGIQATGNLTLGNYLGAIKKFIELQEQTELFAFVADLHSLTTDLSAKDLKKNIKDTVAIYLAAGLDPKKTCIFQQSGIYEHSVMQWILTNHTSIGELSRMTQYKDKTTTFKMKNQTHTIPTGLLTYPVLMASDILLYNADLVPVGKDQKQHLELTKTIAKRLNQKYHLNFKIPEAVFSKQGAKIMSLIDPTKKMSKSTLKKKSTIFLLDDIEVSKKKIISAVTDSEGKVYISKEKPGISNLIEIYHLISDLSIDQIEKKYQNHDYGIFKNDLANILGEFLKNLQTKYKQSLVLVDQVLEEGKLKAQKVANHNLQKLMKKLGLN